MHFTFTFIMKKGFNVPIHVQNNFIFRVAFLYIFCAFKNKHFFFCKETIIIQDRIEDLKLVTRSVLPQHATVFGTVTWLDFSISQGTNVTYDLSISDGDNFTFVHDEPLALDPSDAAHNGKHLRKDTKPKH